MNPAAGIPFEAIVEQSVAGIYVIQDDRFVYANSTWAAIAGYTPEEVIGMPLARIVPPDFLDEVRQRVETRLRGDPPSMHFITRGLHREGHVVLVEVHGSRMDYRGRPAVIGVGVDVTERLHNEAEQRRLLAQLQAFSSHTAARLEAQRSAFAREVQEVLGGMLSNIRTDAARVLHSAQGGELQALTERLLGLTRQTIEAVGQIAAALGPASEASPTPPGQAAPAPLPPHRRLSEREQQLLPLLLKGLSPTEIGARMGISVKTVSTHRGNIFRKLEVASTAQLVLYAVRHDLVP
ncbi:PAS domain S-box protein [Variovorax sp. J22P168]|uniref:PAS domain S-box protein n=1 Tax=Variovorax jilinensis TaxID=3053513 RepID=UPI002578106C|nr:PAS domain S-box protein [Variovorax sp. J22P168]MDM0012021.1 PAS domain S-box protein [Variovorax sp. J22P168]